MRRRSGPLAWLVLVVVLAEGITIYTERGYLGQYAAWLYDSLMAWIPQPPVPRAGPVYHPER